MTDLEREAAIGRAVVEWFHPDNERALRQATPALVVESLERMRSELRSLNNSRALRVGRLMLDLADVCTEPR